MRSSRTTPASWARRRSRPISSMARLRRPVSAGLVMHSSLTASSAPRSPTCCWTIASKKRSIARHGSGSSRHASAASITLVHVLGEDRDDQVVLAGEAAEQRRLADAGTARDLGGRGVETALREHVGGRGEDPQAVACGIGAERRRGLLRRGDAAKPMRERERHLPIRSARRRCCRSSTAVSTRSDREHRRRDQERELEALHQRLLAARRRPRAGRRCGSRRASTAPPGRARRRPAGTC